MRTFHQFDEHDAGANQTLQVANDGSFAIRKNLQPPTSTSPYSHHPSHYLHDVSRVSMTPLSGLTC